MTVTANDPFLVTQPRISRAGFARVLREHAAPGVVAERDPGAYYDAILATHTADGRFVDPLFILAMSSASRLAGVVERRMALAIHYHQILRSIVARVLIHVMYDFVRFEHATERLLGNKPMLRDEAANVGRRVLRPQQVNVTTGHVTADRTLGAPLGVVLPQARIRAVVCRASSIRLDREGLTAGYAGEGDTIPAHGSPNLSCRAGDAHNIARLLRARFPRPQANSTRMAVLL